MPNNIGEILSRYKKIVVPEMNMGQLVMLLRAEFLVDAQAVSKINGIPFTTAEIEAALLEALGA